MEKLDFRKAKTQLSKLLKRVEKGEAFIITRNGKPVAELAPVSNRQLPRRLGGQKGTIVVSDDFNAPLPDEILAAFEGREKP